MLENSEISARLDNRRGKEVVSVRIEMDFVRLDRADTVVTATRSLSPGCEIEQIATRSAIPSGHKVATQAMAAGDPVRKYAQVIGYA